MTQTKNDSPAMVQFVIDVEKKGQGCIQLPVRVELQKDEQLGNIFSVDIQEIVNNQKATQEKLPREKVLIIVEDKVREWAERKRYSISSESVFENNILKVKLN